MHRERHEKKDFRTICQELSINDLAYSAALAAKCTQALKTVLKCQNDWGRYNLLNPQDDMVYRYGVERLRGLMDSIKLECETRQTKESKHEKEIDALKYTIKNKDEELAELKQRIRQFSGIVYGKGDSNDEE